jgi:hypothetical protein
MAEKEHIKEEVVTEKTSSGHLENGVPVRAAGVRRHSRQWVIAIVAIVVVVYLMLVVGGLWIFHSIAEQQNVGQNNTAGGMGTARQAGRSGFGANADRTYNLRQSSSDGLTTTTTNTTYTQTEGVVTAVNSDNIVVAGGGKTQTITTNSSTTYANDTKPAVNDTVVVVGTKDGDTITATQIAVYN